MDTETDPPQRRDGPPRRRPFPLVAAIGAAALLLMVVVVVLAAGSGSGDTADDDQDGVELSVGGGDPPPDVEVASQGDPAPDDPFVYFDGTEGTLQDFAGTPVVLNFFASWCPPCIEEMPAFEAVSQANAGEVAFLGLAVADRPADSEAIVERTGVTYPVGSDTNDSLITAFQGLGMPVTALIRADGTVERVNQGPMTGEQLQTAIDELLDE